MQKRWLLQDRYPDDFGASWPEYSPLLLQLLFSRGLTGQQAIDEFFHPDYETDLHDPFLLKDMGKACARIVRALESEEIILVYGDYDVDGVTSSTVLTQTLIELGRVLKRSSREKAAASVDIYIPDREKEGYGITPAAIAEIARRKPSLIVTVDCGVSNVQSVDEINALGIDIIVTDHHHVPEVRPDALAIINPKQPDCDYPFKELAGVGVAFKLAQGLLRYVASERPESAKKLSPGFEKWLLDLVALGTVADCVDLLGENRTLTQYGLLVLNKTRRPGLKALGARAGLEELARQGGIDSDHISFALAPRLNAAGRMDHANVAYRLLNACSRAEAEELADKLEKSNQNRQRLCDSMLNEIRERVRKRRSLPRIVVEKDAGWKIGLVGLVAGKLTEEFARPFLILRAEEDGVCSGSGRSIPAFNLIEAIEECREFLLQFGGHSQAAGMKVKKRTLTKFAQKMNAIADKTLTEEDLIPTLSLDMELPVESIGWELLSEIARLAPFGYANRKPVLLVRGLEVHEVRAVGSKKEHLRATLKAIGPDGQAKYLSAIAFRLGHLLEDMPGSDTGLRWGDKVDVVFQPEANTWNGNRELQLNVLDLKLSD